jgi:hypothetical protein
MKWARYRIPGESVSTRWRGAKDLIAGPNLSCSQRERQTESVADG